MQGGRWREVRREEKKDCFEPKPFFKKWIKIKAQWVMRALMQDCPDFLISHCLFLYWSPLHSQSHVQRVIADWTLLQKSRKEWTALMTSSGYGATGYSASRVCNCSQGGKTMLHCEPHGLTVVASCLVDVGVSPVGIFTKRWSVADSSICY